MYTIHLTNAEQDIVLAALADYANVLEDRAAEETDDDLRRTDEYGVDLLRQVWDRLDEAPANGGTHRLDEVARSTARHLTMLINAAASCPASEVDVDREVLIAIDRVNWLTMNNLRAEAEAV